MTVARLVLAFTLAALTAPALPAQEHQSYVGVITDTMCGANHAAMNIKPDAKCVRECVKDGKTFQYALLVGKEVYKLSDQETPAKYAAEKVRVTGVLYTKTRILKVERIESVN